MRPVQTRAGARSGSAPPKLALDPEVGEHHEERREHGGQEEGGAEPDEDRHAERRPVARGRRSGKKSGTCAPPVELRDEEGERRRDRTADITMPRNTPNACSTPARTTQS